MSLPVVEYLKLPEGEEPYLKVISVVSVVQSFWVKGKFAPIVLQGIL